MGGLSTVQQVAVMLLPLLFAVTVHETAHGWMASKLGDNTAKMMGRLTLNPIAHIDPVGTLVVPIATFLLTGFIFGWAKPVPVNWRNLHHLRRDMALVALAGPGSNLLMAIMWGLTIKGGTLLWESSQWIALPMIYMGAAGVLINVILMVLNLLPIVPLDGGRVVAALLPPRLAVLYSRLEPYGLFIIVGLLVSGILNKVLWPLVVGTIELLPAAGLVKQLFFT
ncbi:MAG TPA: site-2 protease family protein [Chromatiales bacterium]|nr:site-2 protease family protein [Chromatiales bacterium]